MGFRAFDFSAHNFYKSAMLFHAYRLTVKPITWNFRKWETRVEVENGPSLATSWG